MVSLRAALIDRTPRRSGRLRTGALLYFIEGRLSCRRHPTGLHGRLAACHGHVAGRCSHPPSCCCVLGTRWIIAHLIDKGPLVREGRATWRSPRVERWCREETGSARGPCSFTVLQFY